MNTSLYLGSVDTILRTDRTCSTKFTVHCTPYINTHQVNHNWKNIKRKLNCTDKRIVQQKYKQRHLHDLTPIWYWLSCCGCNLHTYTTKRRASIRRSYWTKTIKQKLISLDIYCVNVVRINFKMNKTERERENYHTSTKWIRSRQWRE